GRYARMDLGDDVAQRATVGRADPDLITDRGVPERDEHAAARVRVEIRVRPGPGYRRARQVECVVLWCLLQHGIALDVALEDREIDTQSWHLDAEAGWDRRQWRR